MALQSFYGSVGADLSASAKATADPPKREREGGKVGPYNRLTFDA
jgi:hypothetical protein